MDKKGEAAEVEKLKTKHQNTIIWVADVGGKVSGRFYGLLCLVVRANARLSCRLSLLASMGTLCGGRTSKARRCATEKERKLNNNKKNKIFLALLLLLLFYLLLFFFFGFRTEMFEFS